VPKPVPLKHRMSLPLTEVRLTDERPSMGE
jgi:hypothetical protein